MKKRSFVFCVIWYETQRPPPVRRYHTPARRRPRRDDNTHTDNTTTVYIIYLYVSAYTFYILRYSSIGAVRIFCFCFLVRAVRSTGIVSWGGIMVQFRNYKSTTLTDLYFKKLLFRFFFNEKVTFCLQFRTPTWI